MNYKYKTNYQTNSFLLVGFLILNSPIFFGCSDKKEIKTTQTPTTPPAPTPPSPKPPQDGDKPGDGQNPPTTDPNQPQPPPQQEIKIYSRIFCESNVISSSSFTTFRSDANEKQLYADINLYEGQTLLSDVYKPQVISSTDLIVDLFFSQKTSKTTRLMRASVSLQKRQALSWEFLSYENFNSAITTQLDSEKIQYSPYLLSESAQWVLVPQPATNSYSLVDLNTNGTIQKWAIDPKSSSVAAFSANGSAAAFYQLQNQILRINIVSASNGKTFLLPLSIGAKLQISPVITADGNVYWLERTAQNTLLKAIQLFDDQHSPSSAAQAVVLKTLPLEAAAPLQVVTQGEVDTLFLYIKDGLEIIDMDPHPFKMSSQKHVSVPVQYKNLLDKMKGLGQWPFRMNSMPWTNQILLSFENYGGTLIYNYEKDLWKVAGVPGTSNLCLNPGVGAEIISGENL